MAAIEVVQTAEPVDNYESITQTKNALHDETTKQSTCCDYKEWNWFRWSVWSFLLLTSLLMCSLSAPYYSFNDSVLTWNHYHSEKFWVYLHITFCFWPMLLGIWQLNGPLRRKYKNLHRWFGRIYVATCIIGTIAGLYMATNAHGGFAGRLAFTFIGILWLITTVIAVYYIKFCKKDREFCIKNHRIWMIRSFALMIAVAMFRYWLPLFKDGLGYGRDFRGEDVNEYDTEQEYEEAMAGFQQAYAAAAWFCWVFNLCVAEGYMFVQSTYIEVKK